MPIIRVSSFAVSLDGYARKRPRRARTYKSGAVFRPCSSICEDLFAGMDLTELGYRCTEHVSSELALPVKLKKET